MAQNRGTTILACGYVPLVPLYEYVRMSEYCTVGMSPLSEHVRMSEYQIVGMSPLSLRLRMGLMLILQFSSKGCVT